MDSGTLGEALEREHREIDRGIEAFGSGDDDAVTALREGTYRDDVAADIAQAGAYGIRGVPFFVIDGRYGVSGAQDPQLFADALRRAADEVDVESEARA
jgi:predicted DsbA family dithiol-disulfide isomerase